MRLGAAAKDVFAYITHHAYHLTDTWLSGARFVQTDVFSDGIAARPQLVCRKLVDNCDMALRFRRVLSRGKGAAAQHRDARAS